MHVQCACISRLHGANAGPQQRAPGAPNLSWGVSLYLLHDADCPHKSGVPPEFPGARLVQRSERVAGGPGERAAVAAALEAQGTEA